VSERIFGIFLLLIAAGGIFFGWGLAAPISYEPVGPRAFPLLVFALLTVCSLGLIATRRPPTAWAPAPVLRRIGAMFVIILGYALLFDLLGFILATTLASVPLGMLFGGSWKQSVIGGAGLGVGLFLLFDRLLDVALPTGLWLKPLLG
jgi:putative tricarboxylic transport membrane protein